MIQIDVIYNIFGEEDIALMPDDTLGLLYPLIDQYLAELLQDFLDNPDGNAKAKDNIQRVLGNKLYTYVLPKKLSASGTLDLVRSLNVYNLAESNPDYVKSIETLEYINTIRKDLKPFTEPRSKDAFDKFVAALQVFDREVTTGRKYKNCAKRVSINKDIFYRPREKSIPTPVRAIVSKADQIDTMIKGLKYLQYCQEHNVDESLRRNF